MSSFGLPAVKSSGPFQLLESEEIKPNKELFRLDLGSLPKYPEPRPCYVISCEIINKNYQNQYPVVLGISPNSDNSYDPYNLKITINDATYSPVQGYVQAKLDLYKNFIIISGWRGVGNLTWKDYIGFYNFDNKDSVTLQNCIATYK